MKTIIVILALAAGATQCKIQRVKAGNAPVHQAPVDTMQYVAREIIGKKQFYVGKPLQVLLDSLQLPVKAYLFGAVPINRFISNDLSLSFVNASETGKRIMNDLKPVILTVTWQTPVPLDTVIALNRKTQGEWTPETNAYFSKGPCTYKIRTAVSMLQ